MKDVLRVAVLVAVVAVAAVAFVRLREGKGYALKTGGPAPGFRLPGLAGGETELASLRGRWVLVNFWATWCPPCVEEMPSLERLYRTLGPEGLVVLGVSADEDEGELRRFLTQGPVSFPILRDPGGRVAASAYRTTGYPETFLVDPDGVLRESYVGPVEWDAPPAIDHFRGFLRTPRTAPTR